MTLDGGHSFDPYYNYQSGPAALRLAGAAWAEKRRLRNRRGAEPLTA
jgi:hypothetical protein